jgi:hypothetical protein
MFATIALLVLAFAVGGIRAQPSPALAIVGATLIDGNGGPPVANAVVVVSGGRITAVGARGSTTIPAGAQTSTPPANSSCPASWTRTFISRCTGG